MTEDIKTMVTELMDQGNNALKGGNLNNAIAFYTSGIILDPSNFVLYSKRSAAYAKAKEYIAALEDAEEAIQRKSDWSEGYSRKGAALAYLKCYKEAIKFYEQGLKYDPNNVQLKEDLKEVKERLLLAPENNSSNPFTDPSVLLKLHNDNRTKYFCRDPKYFTMVSNLISDPTSMTSLCLNDYRMLITASVILDIDLSKADDGDNDIQIEEASLEMPMETNITEERIKESEQEKSVNWNMEELIKNKLTTKEHELEKKTEDLLQSQNRLSAVYKEVDELKSKLVTALENLGLMALNAGNVGSAIEFYTNAIVLDPSNHVLYLYRSAAYAKAMKYPDALTDVDKAVKISNSKNATKKSSKNERSAILEREQQCEELIDANNVQLKDSDK